MRVSVGTGVILFAAAWENSQETFYSVLDSISYLSLRLSPFNTKTY